MANETEVEGDPAQAASDELVLAQTELAERTLDLQRLQAEFLNYKRRVDRDRELVKQNAVLLGADRDAAGPRRHRPGPRAR